MIIAITEFNLRPNTSRSEITELYQRSAKAWGKNNDLVQKYYYYDEANCRGGGIYIWTSREAAQRWLGEDYRDMVRRTYGSAPRIEILDVLLHVDPPAGSVAVLA